MVSVLDVHCFVCSGELVEPEGEVLELCSGSGLVCGHHCGHLHWSGGCCWCDVDLAGL